MNSLTIKTSVKIGIATALAIILFQVSNIFLVYKYFKFDYYLTAIAILFLIAGYLISRYQQPAEANDTKPDKLSELSGRELSILKMIVEGKSNKEIATTSFIEVSTVKTHINNIYAKLGLQNRREAVARYRGQLG